MHGTLLVSNAKILLCLVVFVQIRSYKRRMIRIYRAEASYEGHLTEGELINETIYFLFS